jgi:hypothetical protein
MQAELRRQADMEYNRGISISATLTPAPLSPEVAATKGIKRSADKIVLPARLSEELMKQAAHEKALPFWRLSARDGRSTMAAALDYSGQDGEVLLPPKVIQSLWGLEVSIPPRTGLLHQCRANFLMQNHDILPFWRLSVRDGLSTMAAALDFSGQDSEVLVPLKVIQSLWCLT